MVKNIMVLLQQRKPAADPTKPLVETRLKEMAIRLEDYLWKRSSTLAEYSDLSTLKHRLQCLAVYMGKHQQRSQTVPAGAGGRGGGMPNQAPQPQKKRLGFSGGFTFVVSSLYWRGQLIYFL